MLDCIIPMSCEGKDRAYLIMLVSIAEGFEKACDIAVKQLEKISDKVEFDKSNLEVGWCAARSVLEPVFA